MFFSVFCFEVDFLCSTLILVALILCLGCLKDDTKNMVKLDLLQSRSYFGCCTKPTPIIAVDEPSKDLKIQGRSVRKPSLSDDFWSTTTYEMDKSTVESQRSVSSISASNQTSDTHNGGSTSNPSEFVNHG